MKVWELEEGKIYEDELKTTYKIINGSLYYNTELSRINFEKSSISYNMVSKLDFTEYIPPTDWSKVEVDTKVLVRADGNSRWYKRYFAKYYNGKVYTWFSGSNSWSVDNIKDVTDWDEVKLYTEE